MYGNSGIGVSLMAWVCGVQDPGLLNVLDFIFEHEFSEQEERERNKIEYAVLLT